MGVEVQEEDPVVEAYKIRKAELKGLDKGQRFRPTTGFLRRARLDFFNRGLKPTRIVLDSDMDPAIWGEFIKPRY